MNLTSAGAVYPTSTLTITVFLTVGGGTGGLPTQTITATPVALNVCWVAGSALPAPQGLAIKVSDDATFRVTQNSDTLNSWLSVSPSTATRPATIQVSVDPTGLASGTYAGTVTATSSFSVVQVPVTLVIAGLGISAGPNVISLSAPQNYGVSAPQFVQVTAGSGGSLPFQAYAASEGNWLQVEITENEPTARNAWAPEAAWDPKAKEWVIFRAGKQWMMVLQDERRTPVKKNLRLAFAESPQGPWKNLSEPFTPGWVEGPTVGRIGSEWVVYFEHYTRPQHVGALTTRDWKAFKEITPDLRFPDDHRHGTIVWVPDALSRQLPQ